MCSSIFWGLKKDVLLALDKPEPRKVNSPYFARDSLYRYFVPRNAPARCCHGGRYDYVEYVWSLLAWQSTLSLLLDFPWSLDKEKPYGEHLSKACHGDGSADGELSPCYDAPHLRDLGRRRE